jgi:hypothetical protein
MEKHSSVKIVERTHEEATEALHAEVQEELNYLWDCGP